MALLSRKAAHTLRGR